MSGPSTPTRRAYIVGAAIGAALVLLVGGAFLAGRNTSSPSPSQPEAIASPSSPLPAIQPAPEVYDAYSNLIGVLQEFEERGTRADVGPQWATLIQDFADALGPAAFNLSQALNQHPVSEGSIPSAGALRLVALKGGNYAQTLIQASGLYKACLETGMGDVAKCTVDTASGFRDDFTRGEDELVRAVDAVQAEMPR